MKKNKKSWWKKLKIWWKIIVVIILIDLFITIINLGRYIFVTPFEDLEEFFRIVIQECMRSIFNIIPLLILGIIIGEIINKVRKSKLFKRKLEWIGIFVGLVTGFCLLFTPLSQIAIPLLDYLRIQRIFYFLLPLISAAIGYLIGYKIGNK